MKFHFRWGTEARDQKQETRNDCDVISGLEVSGVTDFSYIFLLFFINNVLLYHFLLNLLAHNRKMIDKCVFREA